MNTIRSTYYGWGVLCLAGGGAYYFAKRQINADRQEKFEKYMKKQTRQTSSERQSILEQAAEQATGPVAGGVRGSSGSGSSSGRKREVTLDHVGSPSAEASEDAAAVGHAPVSGEERVRERSKYEAAEPYRSRKGDRFS